MIKENKLTLLENIEILIAEAKNKDENIILIPKDIFGFIQDNFGCGPLRYTNEQQEALNWLSNNNYKIDAYLTSNEKHEFIRCIGVSW